MAHRVRGSEDAAFTPAFSAISSTAPAIPVPQRATNKPLQGASLLVHILIEHPGQIFAEHS
eukprot:3712182-Pyramimonas_sp.AAC.1